MKNTKTFGLLLAFCLSGYFSQAQYDFNESNDWIGYFHTPSQPAVKTIDLVTGVQLQYAEQGDANGIPVIFLHGIGDTWHSFESTLSFLPAGIRAFAITQRGHGNSSKPGSGYRPVDFAADIASFIKQKNLGPVFIAGHSMGGVNAQRFALDYPQLVKGVIIIDSDFAFRNNKGLPEFYEEVLKLGDVIDRKFMDEFQKSTLAKPIDSAYYELLVNESLLIPGNVFKQAFKGIMETDFSKELHKITVPVLIFWGEQDSFCSRNSQDMFLTKIKDARLIIYDETGHALHWEEPERFARDLLHFIKSVK